MRRLVFRAYVKAKRYRDPRRKGAIKTYRDIALELGGLSHGSIFNWMRQDFPQLARLMANGAGGSYCAKSVEARAASVRRLFVREINAALEGINQRLQHLDDPVARGEVLKRLRGLVGELERGPLEEAAF